MKFIALAATLALLSLGALPLLAGECLDADSDGIDDCNDNCINHPNLAQDDTDGDFCGNVCDADFNQDGIVGFDLGSFGASYGTMEPGRKLTEPVFGANVNFADWVAFVGLYNSIPGPSGTTPGTFLCP